MKIDKTFVAIAPKLSYDGYCIIAMVGREMYTLSYFRRPKAISEKSFNEAMEAIEVKFPDGFEFELEPAKVETKAPVKVAKK